jgi:hypothetical protein
MRRRMSAEERGQSRRDGWATRKDRYGPSGASMPYSRKSYQDFSNRPLQRLIAVVHGEGVLTEQQIAKITGMDIVAVRAAEDFGREHLRTKPPAGQWAANVLRRLGLKD